MDSVKERTEFKVNHKHNYYACPVARPGSQLFIVRLEWEAEPDPADLDSSDELTISIDDDGDGDGDDERDFTLAMITFAGLQYVVVGLDRRAHDKVLKIAEELDLVLVKGYPLANSRIYDNNSQDVQHFPISCAADSIYTVEGHININNPKLLMQKKKKESQLVQQYLQTRFNESDSSDHNNESKGNENEHEVELLDINIQPKPRKTREKPSCPELSPEQNQSPP